MSDWSKWKTPQSGGARHGSYVPYPWRRPNPSAPCRPPRRLLHLYQEVRRVQARKGCHCCGSCCRTDRATRSADLHANRQAEVVLRSPQRNASRQRKSAAVIRTAEERKTRPAAAPRVGHATGGGGGHAKPGLLAS
eukprot:4539343-Pleurochrysis_carterae.AAC.4